MTDIKASDILAELDRAIADTRYEAINVQKGRVINPAHPDPSEYLVFLDHAARAFHGMRTYLRSEQFKNKVTRGKH